MNTSRLVIRLRKVQASSCLAIQSLLYKKNVSLKWHRLLFFIVRQPNGSSGMMMYRWNTSRRVSYLFCRTPPAHEIFSSNTFGEKENDGPPVTNLSPYRHQDYATTCSKTHLDIKIVVVITKPLPSISQAGFYIQYRGPNTSLIKIVGTYRTAGSSGARCRRAEQALFQDVAKLLGTARLRPQLHFQVRDHPVLCIRLFTLL